MNIDTPPPIFWVLGGSGRVAGRPANKSTKILTETGRAHVTVGSNGQLTVLGNGSAAAVYWNSWKLSHLFTKLTGRHHQLHGTVLLNVQGGMKIGHPVDVARLARNYDPRLVHYNPVRIGACTLTVPVPFVSASGELVEKSATFQIYDTGGISLMGLPHQSLLQEAVQKMLTIVAPYIRWPRRGAAPSPSPPPPPVPAPVPIQTLVGPPPKAGIDWDRVLNAQWAYPEVTEVHCHPSLREDPPPPPLLPPRDPGLPRPVRFWPMEDK